MDNTEYKNISDTYKALIPHDTVLGKITGNETISKYIAKLPNNAFILDAACGLGFDVISIKNNLPKILTENKNFQVCANDFSNTMINNAKENSKTFNVDIEFENRSFEDLYFCDKWKNKFDLVFVSYAFYTIPNNVLNEFDVYLSKQLSGLKNVMKNDGTLIIDIRDYEYLMQEAKSNMIFKDNKYIEIIKTIHEDGNYYSEYKWNFNNENEKLYSAEITFWKEGFENIKTTTNVFYLKETPVVFKQIFEYYGFKVKKTKFSDDGFVTFKLKLSNKLKIKVDSSNIDYNSIIKLTPKIEELLSNNNIRTNNCYINYSDGISGNITVEYDSDFYDHNKNSEFKFNFNQILYPYFECDEIIGQMYGMEDEVLENINKIRKNLDKYENFLIGNKNEKF